MHTSRTVWAINTDDAPLLGDYEPEDEGDGLDWDDVA